MTLKQSIAAISGATLLIIGLTGCGSSTSATLPDDTAATQENQAPQAEAPASEEPAAAEGTRENPYPLGIEVASGDWKVVVNSVNLDGTEAVAANQFNEAAPEGSVYIIVNYTVTYVGSEDGLPVEVGIDYVTADGKTVNSYDNIVILDTAIDSINALYTDATATGDAAFLVPADTAAQGVLAVRPGMFGDKVFVAVQ